MYPPFEFYTAETTKVAAENVVKMREHLTKYRNLLHPVNSLSADVTRMMADTASTASMIRNISAFSGVALLLGGQWLPGAALCIVAVSFFFVHKFLRKQFQERLVAATKNTDEYYNAVIREQLLPAASALSLRLCTYARDAILFIDKENKEWTRWELTNALNSGEKTETALQFLLSCAVFGFPGEGTPVRELTVEVLEKLRSVSVSMPESDRDLLN